MLSATDEMLLHIEDLEELVRWLAKPYGDNEPVFATQLPDGRRLDTGEMMRELYREIVSDSRPQRETPGAWVQCESCRSWYVAYPGSDRTITGHHVELIAKALQ